MDYEPELLITLDGHYHTVGRWSEALDLLRQYGGEDLYRYITENGQAIPRNEEGISPAEEQTIEEYNDVLKDLRDRAQDIERHLMKQTKQETQRELWDLIHKLNAEIY